MAYYGAGKYTFQQLIAESKRDSVKAYLKYKRSCHYESQRNSRCYIEQWLYNDDPDDIYTELCGFVAGFLHEKSCVDVDKVFAVVDLMPRLGKIYKEMSDKNNWGDVSELKRWEDYTEAY